MNVTPMRTPQTTSADGERQLLVIDPSYPQVECPAVEDFKPSKSRHLRLMETPGADQSIRVLAPACESARKQVVGFIRLQHCARDDIHQREQLAKTYSPNTVTWAALAHLCATNKGPRGPLGEFWAVVQNKHKEPMWVQVKDGYVRLRACVRELPHDAIIAHSVP